MTWTPQEYTSMHDGRIKDCDFCGNEPATTEIMCPTCGAACNFYVCGNCIEEASRPYSDDCEYCTTGKVYKP